MERIWTTINMVVKAALFSGSAGRLALREPAT
jgi:hypothetical protein